MNAMEAKKLVVKTTQKKYLFLNPFDIERIITRSYLKRHSGTRTNGDSKITYVYNRDQSRVATFQLLKEWEEKLQPFNGFIKIRQSCIINSDHIDSVEVSDNAMRVAMKSGEHIAVSRQLRSEVKTKLGLG